MARPDILVTYGADTKKIDQANKKLDKNFKSLAKSAAGIFAGAAVTAGLTNYARGVTESIRLTNRWAQALGVPIEQLDRMSQATKTVGIDTEKFADLLKDLSEKVGLYYRTGTGEAKDTIEGLKLDIEELIKLNPADLFRKIFTEISKLDNRNLRISFVEELGNDFTLLNPLVDNNMRKFNELVDAYKDGGKEMTQAMADTTAEMDARWNDLMTRMDSSFRTMLFGLDDALQFSRNSFERFIAFVGDKVLRLTGQSELASAIMRDHYGPGSNLPDAPVDDKGRLVIPVDLPRGKPKGGAGGGGADAGLDFLDTLKEIKDQYRELENAMIPALRIEREMVQQLELLELATAALNLTDAEFVKMQGLIVDAANEALAALEDEKDVVDETAVSWDRMGAAAGSTLGNIVTGANAAEQALRLLGRVVEFAFNKFLLPSLFPGITGAASGMSMPGGSSLGQGVVTSPTLFTFANGGQFGVAGEGSGPAEAILPLAWGASGNLGVEASGMSPNVNIYNYGADVTTRDGTGGDVDIMVKRMTADIARGGTPLARAFESTYGLTRGRLRG